MRRSLADSWEGLMLSLSKHEAVLTVQPTSPPKRETPRIRRCEALQLQAPACLYFS